MHPATQSSQEPSWPPSGWLTKQQAAERLNLSTSRVFALGEAGTIKTQRLKSPTSGQFVAIFHAGDIERVIFERENPDKVSKLPAKLDKPEVDPLTELFQKTGLMGVRGLPRIERPTTADIARNIEAWVDRPLKPPTPWITVVEAAEYSGLPVSVIERLIKSATLPAIDCLNAIPRTAGRWRVKRSDLDALEGQ